MSRRQFIINHIKYKYQTGSEFNSTALARETNISPEYVSSILRELRIAGTITKVREEAGDGGRRLRFVYVLADAPKTNFATRVLKAVGAKTLADYTDDEILQELKRRVG